MAELSSDGDDALGVDTEVRGELTNAAAALGGAGRLRSGCLVRDGCVSLGGTLFGCRLGGRRVLRSCVLRSRVLRSCALRSRVLRSCVLRRRLSGLCALGRVVTGLLTLNGGGAGLDLGD